MPQNPTSPLQPQQPRRPGNGPRPGQDIVTTKREASNFPAIGTTLSSYQKSTSDKQPKVDLAKKSRFKRMRSKITLKRSIVSLLVLLVIAGGVLGGKFLYNLHKVFGGSIFDLLHTTKLKGEDQGRVTILLAGNSADDPGHNGANLTDSIMLISLDTKNNTAWMLSIPRDLWVNVGYGNGYQKINDAYVVGGMSNLQNIVSRDFGIPIDYNVLIDYSGIKEAVNAVGGINIDVNSSDPRGIYDPDRDYEAHTVLVDLSNGEHHLDGEQALDLARARGDAYGSYGYDDADFTRTMYQREMLVALAQKAQTSSVLSNPLKLTQLFDALGSSVKTNLNLADARRLYDLTKLINLNKAQSLSLNNANGQDLLTNYNSDGEDALAPAAGLNDYSDIQAFVAQHTSDNPIVQEDASVAVLNATDTNGLASLFKSKLESDHIDVDQIGDADNSLTTTEIINNSDGKDPATLASLKQTFAGATVTTTNPYSGSYNQNFIVVLGNDQADSASQP